MNNIIYYIENLINEKIYIGSTSKGGGHRKSQHFNSLKRNDHTNKHLQSSYNKYGENSFVFGIICECKKEDLVFAEQHYFDKLKPEYNKNLVAGRTSHNKYYRGKDHHNSKEVFMYDLEGNFIQKFDTVNQASELFGKGVYSSCEGTNLTCNNKIFLLDNNINTRLSKINNTVRHNSVIIHTDKNGNILGEYLNLNDAENNTGFKKAYIRRVCNGHRQHHKGNVFVYKNRVA